MKLMQDRKSKLAVVIEKYNPSTTASQLCYEEYKHTPHSECRRNIVSVDLAASYNARLDLQQAQVNIFSAEVVQATSL